MTCEGCHCERSEAISFLTVKTYSNLYDRITAFDNLLLAAKKAQKGKRFKKNTAHFNFELERELLQLQEELKNKTYAPGKYKQFYVKDTKKRLISAAPYRDRVAHHALMNVVAPLFERSFIFDSTANQKGKGNHKAMVRFKRFFRANKFVLR